MNLNFVDALRAANCDIILPGDPEPEWLYRNAEQRRVLAQARRERRRNRPPRLHRRLAVRLRLASGTSGS